ncbi:hypothetical protein [Peribacillus sp. NPDC058075]
MECEIERNGLRPVISDLLMDAEACFLKEGDQLLAEDYIELRVVVAYLLK